MPTKASAQPTPLLQTVTQTQTEYPIQSKDGNSGDSKTSPPSQSKHKQTKWFETWIFTCTLFEKNTPVSNALIWLFVLGIFSEDLTIFSGPIQAIQVLKYFWKFRLFFANQSIVRTSNNFILTITHLCDFYVFTLQQVTGINYNHFQQDVQWKTLSCCSLKRRSVLGWFCEEIPQKEASLFSPGISCSLFHQGSTENDCSCRTEQSQILIQHQFLHSYQNSAWVITQQSFEIMSVDTVCPLCRPTK